MVRFLLLFMSLAWLAACSPSGDDLDEGPVPLGDFKLGHNVVVAPNAVKGPLSRKASPDELTEALQSAIADRFDRYGGETLYHFGVSVEGYVLAAPGIPLVYSPKSVMIINVTVWDDAAAKKLNDEPEQITVFESLSGETVISSGLTQDKETQLRNLSVNASKQIELFLVKMRKEKGWLPDMPDPVADVDADAAETAAEIVEDATG